jgi:hypothetical protein
MFIYFIGAEIATELPTGRSGVRIPAGVKVFLFSKTSRQVLGVHSASYLMGYGVVSGDKVGWA